MADLDNPEALQEMLKWRLKSARQLEKDIEEPPLSKLQGISKLKSRLASELKFLEGLESGKSVLEKKYIETSNVTHFENMVTSAKRLDGVTAIFYTFSILDPQTEVTLKHTVDLVALNGSQWVKIISRSAKGICMDWLTGSSRNIFEQADTYLNMASFFQRNYQSPEVVFEFVSGIPDKMAFKLRNMGVTVIGDEIPINSITKVPEDFLEMLEETEEDDTSTIEGTSTEQPPVNLDVSAVFVLVSNLTHENGTNHRFGSALLTQQCEMEKETPARKQLLEQISGRELIICQTAYDSVRDIMSTVGGPSEKKRMEELFKNVRVVDDNLSLRTNVLKESDRINKRSMVIFGSGDHYRAVTATANKHFVSSAYHQGVSFDVILHESRALSEQKEMPLKNCQEE